MTTPDPGDGPPPLPPSSPPPADTEQPDTNTVPTGQGHLLTHVQQILSDGTFPEMDAAAAFGDTTMAGSRMDTHLRGESTEIHFRDQPSAPEPGGHPSSHPDTPLSSDNTRRPSDLLNRFTLAEHATDPGGGENVSDSISETKLLLLIAKGVLKRVSIEKPPLPPFMNFFDFSHNDWKQLFDPTVWSLGEKLADKLECDEYDRFFTDKNSTPCNLLILLRFLIDKYNVTKFPESFLRMFKKYDKQATAIKLLFPQKQDNILLSIADCVEAWANVTNLISFKCGLIGDAQEAFFRVYNSSVESLADDYGTKVSSVLMNFIEVDISSTSANIISCLDGKINLRSVSESSISASAQNKFGLRPQTPPSLIDLLNTDLEKNALAQMYLRFPTPSAAESYASPTSVREIGRAHV